MIIEKIAKKDRRNVVINFDNGTELIINYEIFLKSGLKKGFGITSDRFSFLIEENKKHYVKTSAINLLAKRIQSEKELRLKLLRKKYEKEMVNEVIEELKQKGLIDDYKFALIYSEEKIRTKLWGQQKIKGELIHKGISNEIISKIIEEKFPPENKFENAFQLASKKIKSLSHRKLDKRKLAERIYLFLSSKGYDYSTSREVVEKVLEEGFIE